MYACSYHDSNWHCSIVGINVPTVNLRVYIHSKPVNALAPKLLPYL